MRELADITRHLQEGVEPRPLARAEAVAELLEVAREEAGRIAVARARLVREPLGLGAREPDRGDERLLELAQPFDDRLRRCPDREHHRQPRALEPQPAEVVVRRRVLEGAPEGRVADQELRVGVGVEREDLRLREQDVREDDGRRALGGHGDGADLAERGARHELDRVDGALRRDAEARQEAQPGRVPRVLDRRDRRDVDLAGEKHPVELGRDARHLLHLVGQPVEDRRHVDVRDAAEPDHELTQR